MKHKLMISGEAKFGLIVVLGLCLIYFTLNFSPWAQVARQNVLNSEKLRIGMPEDEVLQIMGEPDRAEVSKYSDPNHKGVWRHKGLKWYYYRPPAFADDGIYIWMDAADTVVSITYFELWDKKREGRLNNAP